MLDPALLEMKGAPSGSRFIPLATIKFIAGLQTQRSPFASVDTRYNSRYLGGKPDALIAGSNVEISNALTLQRRPGLLSYGPSIPSPLAFFEHKQSAPVSAQTIVDTVTAIYNYSSTAAGIIVEKSPNAGQTNFMTVVNTLYMCNGVDLYKLVGPNLLLQSNNFISSLWTSGVVSFFTPGQFDPVGGLNATSVGWSNNGFVAQTVTPNYTPVAGNTFTFSVWARATSGTPNFLLTIKDQNNVVCNTVTFNLSQTWARYQVTATMGASSTAVQCIFSQASGIPYTLQAYAAQLEIGGPATPAQITTTQPQGVYLWGIIGPTVAPAISSTAVGAYWQATHAFATNAAIVDSNGNKQVVTAGGGGNSGGTVPVWATTKGSTTTDGALTWTNSGPFGLTPHQGYQWYYAFLNPYTGQPSNVSPISASSSTLMNNLGVSYNLSGTGSPDPQVTQVAIYRNVDGGPFFFQVGIVANPGTGGTWAFTDSVQDVNLSSIYAPIGGLNSPPPSGTVNPVWYQSRAWVSVGANLYYSSSTDNAALLNVQQNGVVPESYSLSNVIPLDQLIVRSLPTSSGLLVQTISDFWLITGSDLSSFNPVKALIGHGIRNYNATDSDGSTIWAYTSDRQFLSLNASAGSVEVGYVIGDVLTSGIDPVKAYVVRHVGGSLDNAVFLGDGATGWYRMNPNQVGASVSGEPTTVWSPFATIVGGAQALGSIETSPGVHKFLVGQPGSGSVLPLGQLAGTGASAAGAGTAWANPSNLTLNNPATPATVTLNVQASTGGANVFGGASGLGTSVSTGSVTTGFNNELGIVGVAASNDLGGTSTITAGGSWTLDYSTTFRFYHDATPDNMYWCFGSQSQSLAAAGAIAGTATLSRSQTWDAVIATFVSGSGTAPTIVQQAHGSANGYPVSGVATVTASPAAGITKGNFLVVVAGCEAQDGLSAASFTVTDSLGNVFTKIVSQGATAIFLAPILTSSTDVVTLHANGFTGALALNVYEITLPVGAGTLTSNQLQGTNYALNVPNNNVIGVKVFVTGSQSSLSPDATLTLSWISPSGSAPSYSFQLPLTSGTVSFGGPSSTWGQALTAALLNNSAFGFQLQASVTVTPNVTFSVSAMQVQVFYLSGAVATFPVLVRDLSTFSDNGSTYTWSATLGSLVLAYAGELAEVESITTVVRAANGTQPAVGVLLDEITGSFETLVNSVNDPPQLAASASLLSRRFYLSQGVTPPLCQHLQVQLSGGATATKDELLALVIRGARVPEQEGA